jgi:thiosulfate/3-mercaptopyruvate sulfurtransferase
MFKDFHIPSKRVLFYLSLVGLSSIIIGGFMSFDLGRKTEDKNSYSFSRKTNINVQKLANHWVVNSQQAEQLIAEGATVLDARGNNWLIRERLGKSAIVNWQDFSELDKNQKGIILKNNTILTKKLRAIGISNNRPVVVFADPLKGWGEDGRIVWMLRTLGHQKVVLVDGGYPALIKAGVSLEKNINQDTSLGDFTIKYNSNWQINREQLKQVLNNQEKVIIDVREKREFQGETPYGEQRSGHIPGAIHLYYRELLDQGGFILPPQEIISKLQALGVPVKGKIVVYCTAGVRAGWVTSVLTDLGFQVQNYAGSMLDWSSASAEDYPLSIGN